MSRAAAGLVIGNEVLTAKVRDRNGVTLIEKLRARGIPLAGLFVVPDDVDAIVEALCLARRRASLIFTSGGIGPTHDDVTVRAVALALKRPVVMLPEIVKSVTDAFGGKPVPAEALRLAEAPQGSRLIPGPKLKYPVLACDDLYLLPGVPELFEAQLDTVLEGLEGQPVVTRTIFLDAHEHELAPVLDAAALAEPEIGIGSYPTFDPAAGYRVRVTVEHVEQARVDAMIDRLVKQLPSTAVIRVD
ncbi:MAG: competence/damage-inducible protein A [Myxococcaceae bacterium]|nr:competence/damage-inducible protein A [Myxococcaceae bacterium]